MSANEVKGSVKDSKVVKGVKVANSTKQPNTNTGKGSKLVGASNVTNTSSVASAANTGPAVSMVRTYYLMSSPLSGNEPMGYALPRVYGIGKGLAAKLCRSVGISPLATVEQCSSSLPSMESVLNRWGVAVGGDLRRVVSTRIGMYMSVGSRRGIRMRLGLPVRGQRTSTNCSTAKRRNPYRRGTVGMS